MIEGYTSPEADIEKVKSFDEQWANPLWVKTFGAEPFRVYITSPEKLKDDIPLVIGLGWSETAKSHKNHMREWFDNGVEVMVPDTPHGIETGQTESYPEIELKKMSALLETLRATGFEIKEGKETGKVDIMGRSEGAIFAIIFAYLYPQLVRSLILENPVGLTGNIDAGKFFIRWLKDRKQEILKEYTETAKPPPPLDVDFFEVLRRDKKASIQSVIAISSLDMREMLKEIKAQDIGIAIIATGDDKLAPIEKMAGSVEKDPLSIVGREIKVIPELTSEYVDGFYSLEGTHISYFKDPKKFAMVVDSVRTALAEKKKKENANLQS